tara:strand:- start:6114 stop:6758 length:645 start_codon:yes stop_codon:yes gene_type:complete
MNKSNQTKFKSKTSEILLKLNAIKLSPKNPFNWSSGWKSPIYCDNRIILSCPKSRNLIADFFTKIIKDKYIDSEAVAGVATGAIGIGILVAEKLDLPFVYVRPKPKKHGRKNQIEGDISKIKKIIVIEDLISTGLSSLNAVKALRNSKLEVLGMLAIFTYGFKISEDNFKNEKVNLETLSDFNNLIKQALHANYISKKDVLSLEKWNNNPEKWF